MVGRVWRLMAGVALVLVALSPGMMRRSGAAPPFNDVPPSEPAYSAINELAARGIIKGCDPAANLFCPGDPTLRAQMAALIARAMGWDAEDWGNQFADRCNEAGCIDDDLWRNVGTLQHYGVATGYGPEVFGPRDAVLKQQVVLFVSRALVK